MALSPPEDVDQSSYWPSDSPLDNSDLDLPADGAWRLDMLASGHLYLRKRGESLVPGSISVYHGDDERTIYKAFVMCRQGYGQDLANPYLSHQQGVEYIFNWVTGSLFQVDLARRIIHLYVSGRVDDAWEAGKMAETLAQFREMRERNAPGEIAWDDPRRTADEEAPE